MVKVGSTGRAFQIAFLEPRDPPLTNQSSEGFELHFKPDRAKEEEATLAGHSFHLLTFVVAALAAPHDNFVCLCA